MAAIEAPRGDNLEAGVAEILRAWGFLMRNVSDQPVRASRSLLSTG